MKSLPVGLSTLALVAGIPMMIGNAAAPLPTLAANPSHERLGYGPACGFAFKMALKQS
jgi:hypothetical protein